MLFCINGYQTGGYSCRSVTRYREAGNLNKYRQTFLLCYRGVGVKKQNSYVLHPKIKKHLICGFVTC